MPFKFDNGPNEEYLQEYKKDSYEPLLTYLQIPKEDITHLLDLRNHQGNVVSQWSKFKIPFGNCLGKPRPFLQSKDVD